VAQALSLPRRDSSRRLVGVRQTPSASIPQLLFRELVAVQRCIGCRFLEQQVRAIGARQAMRRIVEFPEPESNLSRKVLGASRLGG